MNEYQPRPGDITLFVASEEDKARAGQALALSGRGLDLSGQECWASMYKATKKDGTPVTTKDGKPVYNLRLKPKVDSALEGLETKSVPKHQDDDFEDSIPF